MSIKKIHATLKGENQRKVEAEYNLGSNLQEAEQLFGADVVYTKFVQSAIIDLQALMRRMIKANKTDQEIQTAVANWKPGITTAVRKSPEEKAKDALSGLTPEQVAALLKQYGKDGTKRGE